MTVALVVLATVALGLGAALVLQASRSSREFLALLVEVRGLIADDRVERRSLLHLLGSRNMADYAATERAVAQADDKRDVRRPRHVDDLMRDSENILARMEAGITEEPGSSLPEGMR